MDKNTYKLLTPGPLTTTETVKEAMQIDRCTWDEDYKNMTQEIRTGLLKLAHADNGDYTTVLMQGSGTFGVESVLSGVISSTDKVLVLQNGAYSKRMVEMCDYHGIKYVVYEEDYAHVPDPAIVEDVLKSDGNITHISMVHSETTSGLLNNIAAIGELAVFRIEESCNNRPLMCFVDIGFKAKLFHAFAQSPVGCGIACIPCGNAAFCCQFFKRLAESRHNMGRRSKTPFAAVFFHSFPLGI